MQKLVQLLSIGRWRHAPFLKSGDKQISLAAYFTNNHKQCLTFFIAQILAQTIINSQKEFQYPRLLSWEFREM